MHVPVGCSAPTQPLRPNPSPALQARYGACARQQWGLPAVRWSASHPMRRPSWCPLGAACCRMTAPLTSWLTLRCEPHGVALPSGHRPAVYTQLHALGVCAAYAFDGAARSVRHTLGTPQGLLLCCCCREGDAVAFEAGKLQSNATSTTPPPVTGPGELPACHSDCRWLSKGESAQATKKNCVLHLKPAFRPAHRSHHCAWGPWRQPSNHKSHPSAAWRQQQRPRPGQCFQQHHFNQCLWCQGRGMPVLQWHGLELCSARQSTVRPSCRAVAGPTGFASQRWK